MNTLSGKTSLSQRRSDFELLRIAAMFMIVLHHFSVYGGFENAEFGSIINEAWIGMLKPVGKIGVDIFILISGYFLSGKASLNIKKIIKLWTQIVFYSVVLYVVGSLVLGNTVTVKGFLWKFVPITRETRWFNSTYFILFLVSPLLNLLLEKITRRQHEIALAAGLIIWSVIPTFFGYRLQSNSFIWFIYLYFAAAYIKKWCNKIDFSFIKCLAASAFFLLMSEVHQFIPFTDKVLPDYTPSDMYSIWVFASAVFMFLAFSSLKMGCCKPVNIIASATFGVFLIHDQKQIKEILWNNIFHNADFADKAVLIPYSLLAALAVFCACTAIELIRIYLLEKPFMKLVDRAEPAIVKAVDSAFRGVKKAGAGVKNLLVR